MKKFTKLTEFTEKNVQKLSMELKGKKITEIAIDEQQMDSYLNITLNDKTMLRFRYDWIYDFQIKENNES